MPGPYDVSSETKISELDLTSLGLELTAGSDDKGRDIEFNDTGSAMFILMSNDAAPRDKSYIHYFRLGKDYDISTAKFAGKWNVGDFGTDFGSEINNNRYRNWCPITDVLWG